MHNAQHVLEVVNSGLETRQSVVTVHCKLDQHGDLAITAEAETAVAKLAGVATSRLKIVSDIAEREVRIVIGVSTAAADWSAQKIAQALHQP